MPGWTPWFGRGRTDRRRNPAPETPAGALRIGTDGAALEAADIALVDLPIESRGRRLGSFDKINVGCGYDHKPDHLNVDMDPACQPDLLLRDNNFSNLPKRHFAHLTARDVLEHIPRVQTVAALLEWALLLKTGGTLALQTSSILGVAEMLRERTRFADQLGATICLFGSQAHPGDFHYTGFTETTLRVFVQAAGFEIDSLTVHDQWLFVLQARKATDWAAMADLDMADEAFVRAAYAATLCRPPEDDSLAHHLAGLAAGRPRQALLKHLYASPERCFRFAEQIGL